MRINTFIIWSDHGLVLWVIDMTDSTVKLLESHWLFMVRLNALFMVAFVWSRGCAMR